ncbi:MAG: 50S ribosomal protein L25 [Candidatus Magasanikbacteria bacterium]|jgi:large subunit ribosomal protein L25|nr:50S ribosomal protein L25 [Candidatus Magasanikbacteria bacterium]
MSHSISATAREGKPDAIRESGRIPAVIYGRELAPVTLSVDYNQFEKLYKAAGTSSIIELSIEGGEKYDVLIKDWQLVPTSHRFSHLDFYQVVAGQMVDSTVHLNFIGESHAVKLGGTLMSMLDSIGVQSLPKDLVDQLDVDISVLATFEDSIHVKDIPLPEGMVTTEDKEILVAKVNAPRIAVEEDEEETAAPSIEDIEVEKKGKTEEEAAA